MWANEEVAELVEGLRRHNDRLPEPERIGFYGLEVYSLWASLDAVIQYLKREHASNRLLSFDDVRRGRLVADNRLHRGTRVVEVDEIVGSVGRWKDFDRSFLPARASVGHKWKRIDRAFQRGEELPPVELYEIEDSYFVVDGHHRVSVARYHEVPTVEAAVAEFHPKLPAAPVPTISNSVLPA